MMRTLFIKIFLWFWVAMALIGFACFLAAAATESHPFLMMPWLRYFAPHPTEGHLKMHRGSFTGSWGIAGNSLRLAGLTAVQIYERDGTAALNQYVDEIEKAIRAGFFLFDEQGKLLGDQSVPDEARELSSRRMDEGLDFKRSGESIFTAQKIVAEDGKAYTLVARFPARHLMTRDYSFLAVNFALIMLTAGGVCYWLARYISKPVGVLGAAARRLADGDLKIRVGAYLGRRRDEIGELGEDFDQMAERIESLINSQKRLFRDISHEFRSPLTRLTLALEIARRNEGPDAAKALERIELEAERLNALIGKLLMIARLESGVEEMDSETVGMVELLEELVADADFEARERDCRVRIVSSEDCSVRGSRELLRSAVENVLRNAVRHTGEKTEVTVALRCVRNGGQTDAVLDVRDNGPGVPEAALSNIFFPFYRVGDARDRMQGGTGLGLAITERTVKLHGGRVRAANAPGGGLNVTISLPVQTNG